MIDLPELELEICKLSNNIHGYRVNIGRIHESDDLSQSTLFEIQTNPGDSSRQNVDIEIIEYLNSPPTSHKLQEILQLLGMSPRELMRKNEEPYRSNNLNAPDLTNDELIEFITKYPNLIEHPIVLANERAIIGRPPERVLEII